MSWPPVTSVSRLNEAQSEAEFPFRASPEALPAASYTVSPALVAGGLLFAGLALLAWPARLGIRAWRDRPPVVEEKAPRLTPLERALALVEWARERLDGDDRRRSLEVLAEELERTGAATLGVQASALAWSRAAPSSDAVWALLERVREENGLPART